MTLPRLCMAYLRLRLGTTLLNIALLTLGIATIAVILLLGHQLRDRVEREIRGIDLVVGAKGSPLQLILSTVFHIDVPTGNIPLAEAEVVRRHPLVAQTIPLALGDSAVGFRIVGTEPTLLTDRGGTIARGRLWEGPMEAVLGSDAATGSGLRIGQTFHGSHGLTGGPVHEGEPYTVVGIAERTGTAIDRLILTSIESVWHVHRSSHGQAEARAPSVIGTEEHDDEGDEITALLVRYRSPLAAVQLPRLVNAQPSLQAAVPALEAARLLTFVGFGLDAIRLLGWLMLGAAGLSVLVALTNALADRRADLALMRALGASRALLVRALLLEGLLLAGAGLVAGLFLGHLSVELMARMTPQAGSVGLTGLLVARGEGWLVPAVAILTLAAASIPAVRAYRSDLVGALSRS